MLQIEGLGYSIKKKNILSGVSLHVQPGEVLAVIGPNGSGKSTLLRSIAGAVPYSTGHIQLNHIDLSAYSWKQLALQRAFLSQKINMAFPLTVWDTVMLGRFPHKTTSAVNEEAVTDCLQRIDMLSFRHRNIESLSGGEQQKVHLARVLAQLWGKKNPSVVAPAPKLLLLDEPTASLDIKYQWQALQIARSVAAEGNMVIVALHELHLAAQFADKILILKNGNTIAFGPPAETLTDANIANVFDLDAETLQHALPRLSGTLSIETQKTAAPFQYSFN